MPLYVSSTVVLIIRRSKLYHTAPGIITLCRWPSGAQVERGLCTGRPPTVCDDTRCRIIQFFFYNKFIICLYMFRALLCSSPLGQNCIIQHLVSSHSVGGRPVHSHLSTCAPTGVMIPDAA
jgi:hypothetical protein